MKFSADPKDMKIFGVFCVFLLYLCAVCVLNIHSLATTQSLYGLLPFEAFTGQYIGATFLLFICALAGVLFSVKSYIFEREKGFGFEKKKEKGGYSRWCKDNEMKKTLSEIDPSSTHVEHAGIAIINNGKKVWVDDGEAHNLIIGATGSGKTQAVVFPMIKILAKAGESMILTDPKGELYEGTGEMLREYGYNVIILNFRDPQKGNAWNPMNLPYKLYKEGNSKIYNVPISKKPYTALCVDIFTEEETNEGINITRYINKEGLSGKYSIYIKINDKIYKTNNYIEISDLKEALV